MCVHILRQVLTRYGFVDGADFTIFSGGTEVFLDGKTRISEGARRTLARRGIDASDHVARSLTFELLHAADLVLTMESRHVAQSALVNPAARSRVFALKEIVDALEAFPQELVGDVRSFGVIHTVLSELAKQRAPLPLTSDCFDVPDPVGGSVKRFEECANEIEDLVCRFAREIWGPGPSDLHEEATETARNSSGFGRFMARSADRLRSVRNRDRFSG